MKFKALTLTLVAALPLCSLALERVELLPGDMPYLRVSNIGEFGAKIKKSSLGQLWMDDRFQDFLGNPDDDLLFDLMFEGEDSEEVKELLAEQTRMKTGELVIGFDMKTESTYMIAWMTEEDFRRDQAIDQQIIEVEEESFQIVRSSFQGVEIVEHIAMAGASSSWQTHVGTTFVMADSKEWIEQCIVRLKKEAAKEPEGNPTLNFNLPLGAFILDLVEDGDVTEEDQLIFEAMGLLGVDVFTTRIELLDEHMLVDNHIAISDLQRGLFSILDTEPSELPTVTFIPTDIASIEVGRFDLPSFWKEIPVFLATALPDAKPQFDMMLGMVQQQAGVNFEQDLFAHLGTKYLSYGVVQGDTANSIIALELEDGAAFKKGVETALASPALAAYVATALDITDFLDHQIYTPKSLPPEEQFAVAITSEYLVYGEPDAVRQMIRALTSENAANNAFEQTELVQELRRHITPRSFGFGAIDWKKNMDAVIQELTKPEILAVAQQSIANEDFPLEIDFDQLPSADHIAEFFNMTITYLETTDSGLHQKIILKY